ncbi:POU domain, class 3, transcription factor 1-like [Octopus sinensis]|uniref:POU domain, class 3, transcription factor 1-like n=1 Tax=Octopus sinensis TaxID=2607531 RepID=A0A6P7U8A2_9MOLL|nr:POU domain, class 3, transcription factor 1-like [Octopus sinensis]
MTFQPMYQIPHNDLFLNHYQMNSYDFIMQNYRLTENAYSDYNQPSIQYEIAPRQIPMTLYKPDVNDLDLAISNDYRENNVPHLITEQATVNDETPQQKSLVELGNYFKKKRMNFGYSQSDMAIIMKRGGFPVSRTTISRFELGKLSITLMENLKDSFLIVLESLKKNPISKSHLKSLPKPRKKRIVFDKKIKEYLENIFSVTVYPNEEEIGRIVAETDLSEYVVRVWFGNRRKKERRTIFFR